MNAKALGMVIGALLMAPIGELRAESTPNSIQRPAPHSAAANADAASPADAGRVAGNNAGQLASTVAHVTFVGLTPDQEAQVDHAVDLYRQAGLPLPELVVRASADSEACNGREGWSETHGNHGVISLCTGERNMWERHVILHELAHAWASVALTAEQKEAFRILRGWRVWSDYDQAGWSDNGTEQAAEIIAWGLDDQPAITPQIAFHSCADLLSGYVALTGSQPIHGVDQGWCQSTDKVGTSVR